MRVCCAWVHSRGLFELRCSTSCRLGVFNAIGGCCVLPRQNGLMMWYVTAEPHCVSMPCFRVCDPGGANWSCRPCCVPAFGTVSIFLSSCEHLTLAMASHGAPRGAGTTLGLINRRLLIILNPLSYFYEHSFSLGYF
jgi:hypothetical protein